MTEQRQKRSQSNSSSKQQARSQSPRKSIVLGVCAMRKKSESKPMTQILQRLKCPQIEILYMWDCLQKPWTQWPRVDALICFHSNQFPYLMAWHYVRKYKPFLINNLEKQQLLWDRTVVYQTLTKIGVPVAKHFMIYRDMNYIDKIQQRGFGACIEEKVQLESEKNKMSQFRKSNTLNQIIIKEEGNNVQETSFVQRNSGRQSASQKHPRMLREFHQKRLKDIKHYTMQEVEDNLILTCNDKVHKLTKPFVEKPFDSQNHQICVYYPQSMGGGRKMLFRKIKNLSSTYQKDENKVRKDGNYIYEQFLPTNAFDIKVYTIGSYYMYAEARRSPTLDGIVQRNSEGKEMRFPVILTPVQKMYVRKIVFEFQQQVCGLDLLRANGKSYVCDVNGWSFVKANSRYWDDCAYLLKKKIFQRFFNQIGFRNKPRTLEVIQNQETLIKEPSSQNIQKEELRSIVSIFRHADRSPKEKLKIKTDDPRFIAFFEGITKDDIKLKDELSLKKVLDITNDIISKVDQTSNTFKQYFRVKIVLEAGDGHFQGFTRKVQLKVIQKEKTLNQIIIKKLVLVLKWGGELSCLGFSDARTLGKKMRIERYDANDCLTLYSSYRHDLKTYSSDEGRCIKTAAAFLKGFLNIEGPLAPIITSMVKVTPKAQRLLDCTSEQNHSKIMDRFKERLSLLLNSQDLLQTSYLSYANSREEVSSQMMRVIKEIGYPRQTLLNLRKTINSLLKQFRQKIYNTPLEQFYRKGSQNNEQQNSFESIDMIYNRWVKLAKDFYDQEHQRYNVSILPQIYDTARYDNHKNEKVMAHFDQSIRDALWTQAKLLAYFMVPNEYGIKDEQRVSSAKSIALPLLQKVLVDLMFWKSKPSQDEQYWRYKQGQNADDNSRLIRTRLYFSSASHMHSVLNIITLGNQRELLKNSFEEEVEGIRNILHMGYLSHIEFRLYEQLHCNEEDPGRFRLELSISKGYEKDKNMRECSLGGHGFTINQIKEFIQNNIQKSIKRQSSSTSVKVIEELIQTQNTEIITKQQKNITQNKQDINLEENK